MTAKELIEKLAEAENYTWVETTKMEGGMGMGGRGPTVVEGRTGKDGTTILVSKRDSGDIEGAWKDGKGAVKSEDVWKGAKEAAGEGGGGMMRRDPIVGMAFRLRMFKAPAALAAGLLEKISDVKSESEGLFTGDLDEEAAKSLVFGGRGGGGGAMARFNVEIKEVKGSAKFWAENDSLGKFEYTIQSKISSPMGEMDIGRTTTVEIKDLGSSGVQIPDEAAAKLS